MFTDDYARQATLEVYDEATSKRELAERVAEEKRAVTENLASAGLTITELERELTGGPARKLPEYLELPPEEQAADLEARLESFVTTLRDQLVTEDDLDEILEAERGATEPGDEAADPWFGHELEHRETSGRWGYD